MSDSFHTQVSTTNPWRPGFLYIKYWIFESTETHTNRPLGLFVRFLVHCTIHFRLLPLRQLKYLFIYAYVVSRFFNYMLNFALQQFRTKNCNWSLIILLSIHFSLIILPIHYSNYSFIHYFIYEFNTYDLQYDINT